MCPTNPELPGRSLRKFTEELLFVASLAVPLIRIYTSKGPKSLGTAYSQFMEYKTRVPVCGAILLSEDWTRCVLVKGWGKSASWTFPKGKINQHESQRDCAVREVLEETGYNAGTLLPAESKDYFELTQREQKIRLYVVPGVPNDTSFETQTRREISRIEWFRLTDLPTLKKPQNPAPELGGKFYNVMPFVMRLKRWIQANKRTHPHRPPPQQPSQPAQGSSVNLDVLFGSAPTSAAPADPAPPAAPRVPGLIALPPQAQRRMAEQPRAEAAPSEHDPSKQLLLSLVGNKPAPRPDTVALHAMFGQAPTPAPPAAPTLAPVAERAEPPMAPSPSVAPAPPAHAQQLLHLLQPRSSHLPPPPPPPSHDAQQHIFGSWGPPPQSPIPVRSYPSVPPVPHIMSVHAPAAHQPIPSAAAAATPATAPPQPADEHRNALLASLLGGRPTPNAPPSHAHSNALSPMQHTTHASPGPLPTNSQVPSPPATSNQQSLLSTLLGSASQHASPAPGHASPYPADLPDAVHMAPKGQPNATQQQSMSPAAGAAPANPLLDLLNKGPSVPSQSQGPSVPGQPQGPNMPSQPQAPPHASNALLATLLHGKGM